MKIIEINRNWQDNTQTLGSCTIYNEQKKPIFSSLSLERGWQNNKKRNSCIPLGEYTVVLEWSNKFKKQLWEIKGVPKRSECKFHSANYWYQLNGCIALGQKIKDINKDGYNDITNSKATMRSFHTALKNEKEVRLRIIDNKKCKC